MTYRMKPDILAQKRRREIKALEERRYQRRNKPTFMDRIAAARAAVFNKEMTP